MLAHDNRLGFTQALAAMVERIDPPCGDVLLMTRHCLLDWVAVAVAGVDEPVSKMLASAYANGGDFTVPGGARVASAEHAALVAGTMSHALDYDDVHTAVGHPGAPIIAAALAVAQEQGSDFASLLHAIHAGYEGAIAIGAHAMPSHYDKGFHSTATLGTIGAAIAAAKLMRLDRDRLEMAISLGATQAAGLKAMFGSMAKPFHAGKAAANGVVAATLAHAGFVAGRSAIEGPTGFYATQTDLDDPISISPHVSGDGIMQTRFKRHAACFLTHSSIEVLDRLRRGHGIAPREITSVEIEIPPGHLSVCCIPEPRTGLEVKFSLAHIAAMVLHGRSTAMIASYSDETARDAELTALRNKIMIRGTGPSGNRACVTVHTASGQAFSDSADVDVPYPSLALQEEALVGKFRELVSSAIGTAAAEHLLTTIMKGEAHDRVSLLWNALAAPTACRRSSPSARSSSSALSSPA